EDKCRIGNKLCIEDEGAGELRIRRETVDAGYEGHHAEVLAGQIRAAWQPGEGQVSGGEVVPGLQRDRVAGVRGATGQSGRKSGDRGPGADAQISAQGRRTGVGDGRAAEDR